MPRHPRVRRRTRRGRSPWYTIHIGGREYHLGTDEADAHRRAAPLLKGLRPPSTPQTVRGLCLAWEDAGHPAWQLRRLGDWSGDMALADLMTLDDYARHLLGVVKPATARKYLEIARRACEWSVAQGWSETVPPLPAKLPQARSVPRDIPPERARAIIASLPPQTARLVRFILAVGCRPSEACRMRWVDVRIAEGVVELQQHKTAHHGRPRTLYLTPEAIEVLAECPRIADHVFINRVGRQFKVAGLTQTLRARGISGPYCLRHTAAQAWLDQGVGYDVVAGLLGHANLQTVQRYAQVRNQRLRDAAKMLRGVSPTRPVPNEPG